MLSALAAAPAEVALLLFQLAMLFVALGLTASDYLCPNLHFALAALGLSDRVAGMTLLAVGNGAPDIFSTHLLIVSGLPALAFGEMLGAANFCVCFVVGAMGVARTFPVDPAVFLRDIGCFLAVVSLVGLCLRDGKLTGTECCVLVVVYCAYVVLLLRFSPKQESETVPLVGGAALPALSATLLVSNPDVLPRFSFYDILGLWRRIGRLLEWRSGAGDRPWEPSPPPAESPVPTMVEPEPVRADDTPYMPTPPARRKPSGIHLNVETSGTFYTTRTPSPTQTPASPMAYLLGNKHQGSLFATPTDSYFPTVPLSPPPASPTLASQSTASAWMEFLFPEPWRLWQARSQGNSAIHPSLLLSAVITPMILALNLTVPTPLSIDDVDPDNLGRRCSVKRQAMYLHLITVPAMACIAFADWLEIHWDTAYRAPPVVGAATTAVVSLAVYHAALCRLPDPLWFLPLCLVLGFVLLVIWTNLLSDMVVAVLQQLGVVFGILELLLGLTVFAMGNSVGDLVANVLLARAGLSDTALGACLGAPLLYMLLGLGINGAIENAHTGRLLTFAVDLLLVVLSVGLVVSLLVYLVAVPLLGFTIGRRLGGCMMAWWAAVTATNVVVEVLRHRSS